MGLRIFPKTLWGILLIFTFSTPSCYSVANLTVDPLCGSIGRVKTRLQIAMVVDRTYSFEQFLTKLPKIVSDIYDKLSRTFPGSEVAVTSFSDFADSQRNDEMDKCYKLYQPFTQSMPTLSASIKTITSSLGSFDFEENSLQAIMFTCADKRIGWSSQDRDLDGTIIQRVVILMTDHDDIMATGVKFKDADKRHKPLGDGTDSCTNSFYPDYEIISKVLKQRGVRVIGAIAKHDKTPANIFELYKNHFIKIGVPYDLFNFQLDNPANLASEVEQSIYRTIPCNPIVAPIDPCGESGRAPTRLQIALVSDRTNSFKEYFEILPKKINELHARLSKTFPDSLEFGLTSFADFTATQRYDESDKCYTLDQPLTMNLKDLDKSISKITTSWGLNDWAENSLQGMMFTCADPNFGWNSAKYDSSGKAIVRVLILTTDADDIITTGANFKDADKRHAPKGDGTDSCKASLYPDYKLLSKVVSERNVRVIGAIAQSKTSPPNITGIYKEHFNKIGIGNNSIFQFDLNNLYTLASDLEHSILKAVPCKPEEPEPDICGSGRVPTKLQIAFVVDRTGTFESFVRQLPNIVWDFYKRIIKSFPNSEIAITSFADFTKTQRRYDEMDKCYTLDHKFTDKLANLNQSIAKITISNGGVEEPENSLQAIMFTGADKNIGWNDQDYDASSGVAIQRVIILLTDQDDLISIGVTFKDEKNRHPAKGDSSDTCTNSLYPDHDLISTVLKQRKVWVIGALAKTQTSPPKLVEIYQNHFNQIGVNNDSVFEFKLDMPDDLPTKVASAVFQTIPCKPTISPPGPPDICGVGGRTKTRLQVAFVVDRTYTFREFFSKLGAVVKDFHARITTTFPGSELALTTFGDFVPGTQRYDEQDTCYTLDQSFTISLPQLQASIDKVEKNRDKFDGFDINENVFQAVMFTCTDKNIGWSNAGIDSEGAIIQRVIIVLTDNDDLLNNPGEKEDIFKDREKRRKPLGDGTDSCTNSLLPDYDILSTVLKKRNFQVIVGLAKAKYTPPDLNEIYKQHFEKIGGVHYNLFNFTLESPVSLASDMQTAIYNTVPCKPEISTDVCGVVGRTKTKLQIAFVVDRTGSFQPLFLTLGSIISRLHKKLSVSFPGSEIALTTFGDFDFNTQRYPRYDGNTLCFTLDQSFTQNLADLNASISKVIDAKQFGGDDIEENSLQAIMLTGADRKIGWNNMNYDASGALIQRIIILITDADDLISKRFEFKDKKNRHAPRGDGTDTCTNSLLPDYKLISRVLKQRRVRIVGALAQRPYSVNIFEAYTKHFTQIGVEFSLLPFSFEKLDSLVDDLENATYMAVPCKPEPTMPTNPIDECEESGTKRAQARIQLAFVMDRTASFTTKFYKKFGLVTEKIYNQLNSRFPGTRVAMTLFTDFTSRQWNHTRKPEILNNNFFEDDISCYQRHYKFIDDFSKFKKSMNRIRVFHGAGGDKNEDQLTAIMLTAADKDLGWNVGRQDKKGIFVYKVICMLTDSDTHTFDDNDKKHFLDFEKRRQAKGDSTDSCTNALVPKYEVVAKLLQSKGIRLIGLLSKHVDDKVFDYWNKHFTQLDVPYDLAEFSVDKAEQIFDTLIKSIEMVLPCDSIEVITTTTTLKPPTIPPPSPPPIPPTVPVKNETSPPPAPSPKPPTDPVKNVTSPSPPSPKPPTEPVKNMTSPSPPPPPPPPAVIMCDENRVPTSPSHDPNVCHPIGRTSLEVFPPEEYGFCIQDEAGNFVTTENCPCDPRLDSCPCDPDEDCDEWDPPGYNTLGF